MPNRIIKESICTSDEIDSLSAEEEVFFYRLMVNCDDFGLLDARPKILVSKCYPLKSIDIKRIVKLLSSLVEIGLVNLYEVDGRPYLAIAKWSDHQQIRAKRPKYPQQNEGSAISCNQLLSDAPVIQSNPIQSESNPNPIPQSDDCDGFDEFWVIYEKKGNKMQAQKAWKKIKPSVELQLEIYSQARLYVQATPDKPFRKDASTWLNNQCWNDVIHAAPQKPKGFFAQLGMIGDNHEQPTPIAIGLDR